MQFHDFARHLQPVEMVVCTSNQYTPAKYGQADPFFITTGSLAGMQRYSPRNL